MHALFFKLVFYIFLVLESIFTSDSSSLKPYCNQSPCFMISFYLEDSFSLNLICDPVVIWLQIGFLSNIGFLLSFSSLVFYFVMRRLNLYFNLYDCVSNFYSLQHVDASEIMREIMVSERGVNDRYKLKPIIPRFPTTTLVATIGVHNTNHFPRTVYCLCIVQ